MNAFRRTLSEIIAVKCIVFTQICQETLSFVACFNGSEKFENYLSSPQILKTLSWIFIKGEYKVHPITYHKGTELEYNSIPSRPYWDSIPGPSST